LRFFGFSAPSFLIFRFFPVFAIILQFFPDTAYICPFFPVFTDFFRFYSLPALPRLCSDYRTDFRVGVFNGLKKAIDRGAIELLNCVP